MKGLHATRLISAQRSQGFTLVEVMIALALGAVISLAVIQVMISNSVTERLNRALTSVQENGRFGMLRLQQDVLLSGRYDPLSADLNRSVDIAEEAFFVRQHPVVLVNEFSSRAALGIANGADGSNDRLVVVGQHNVDCRGYHLGYATGEEFPVVNEYFVAEGTLKCRGFDLRVLRGLRTAVGHNNHAAYSLLDGVESFQILYGIDALNNGRVSQYVTADNVLASEQVIAIRIGMLLKSTDAINVNNTQSFAVLNEAPILPESSHVYRQFENTILLRNMKYYVEGGLL